MKVIKFASHGRERNGKDAPKKKKDAVIPLNHYSNKFVPSSIRKRNT